MNHFILNLKKIFVEWYLVGFTSLCVPWLIVITTEVFVNDDDCNVMHVPILKSSMEQINEAVICPAEIVKECDRFMKQSVPTTDSDGRVTRTNSVNCVDDPPRQCLSLVKFHLRAPMKNQPKARFECLIQG